MEVVRCAASNGEKSCDCVILIYGLFKAFPIMNVLMCSVERTGSAAAVHTVGCWNFERLCLLWIL